jgi:hypothetical protein
MNGKQLGLLGLLVGMLGLEAYGVSQVGYLGLFDAMFVNTATVLASADLTIALGLVTVWMWQDARDRGTSIVPYVVLTLALGSVGPLLYLLVRQASVPRRAFVAARAS